jgi:hypothetical protein
MVRFRVMFCIRPWQKLIPYSWRSVYLYLWSSSDGEGSGLSHGLLPLKVASQAHDSGFLTGETR